MLSEIDQLVRQVEHCFNTKSPIPLPKALSQLTQFKGKVKFRFRMDYKCSCHGYFFKQNKSHEDLRDFQCFADCCHFVCHNCMRAYFSPIFNRNGFAHNYCCPGCIAEKRPNKTVIPADIIQYLIPIYIPNEKITEVVDQINQTFQTINVKRTLNSEANCHFAINPGEIRCSKSAKVNNIGTCGHRICLDCLIKYVESKNTIENLKCIVDDCERFMPHTLIRESLKMNEDLLNKY